MNISKKLFVLLIMGITILNLENTLNAQVEWSNIGPGGGGWITALTVVNDDAHTVYVGCDVGGIYKSTDHGKSWTIKDNGLSVYFTHDIAYDPVDPDILYIATRGGVYKSINGGDSWEAKRSGFPEISAYNFSAPISDIVIDPQHRNILYAGVGVPETGYDLEGFHWQSSDVKGTIYKSEDFGENWVPIYDKGINNTAMIYGLAIDPDNSDIVFAATSEGVYKSTNAGATWISKNNGLPHGLTMKMVINPNHSEIMYVTVWAEPESSSWQGGVYKSTNGGNSWTKKNTGLQQVMGDERGFTNNYPTIVMDELHPDTLYVGNMAWTPDPGVYQTLDGGAHWSWVSRSDDSGDDNVDLGWIVQHGITASVIAVDPISPERVYFATSTHVFKTENTGESWTQAYTNDVGDGYWSGNGFETTVVQSIAVDPKRSDNIYVGYWDIGFFKSKDGGQPYKRTFNGMKYDANTFDIIVDPDNSSIVYASCGWWEENEGEIYKSTDYGESWVALNHGLPDAQIWSMALDKNSPINSRTLYAASYENGIYKSIDGGQNWSQINSGLGINGNLNVREIKIDPNNSDILYVGIDVKQTEIGDKNSTIKGGLFKSTNGGSTWIRIDESLPQISVQDIEIVHGNSDIIYTTVNGDYDHTEEEYFYGGVYKSIDGGNSWELKVDGLGEMDNLEITAIEISPTNDNILYITTSDDQYHDECSGRGIFKSIDAGEHWDAINDGLGVLYYDAITIDPSNSSILYAGSGGNGLMKGLDHSISKVTTPDINSIGVYPNPVSNVLYIKGKETIDSIMIVDVNGMVVLQEHMVNGGNSISMDGVVNGIYFVKISTKFRDDWYKVVVDRD